MNTFYITTPIYYPSGKWHLGTAYTSVLCDAVARYKRLDGYDVFYLTGTDEHGQKIEKRALDAGKTPIEFVDQIVDNLKQLWDIMDISYDKFIRTTDTEHKNAVQKIFQKLYDKGEIYKSEYEGFYCTPCESFWTKTQVVDGKCPDCNRPVDMAKEESYFFRLSKYADKLLDLYQNNPNFLLPKSRVNEMANFIKSGLEDLAVSRTSFKWGIPVPFDDKHIIYVWMDALTNYITALGYESDNTALFDKFWPCDHHIMAKEIVRFHAIIWPSILMALDIPLPKNVYGHGWLMMGGDKLSKSKSENIMLDIVDPFILCERYTADAVRFVLLKEGCYAGDTPYTNETLLSCFNSDLANDLGNLLSRTISMVSQYRDGKIQRPKNIENDLVAMANGLKPLLDEAMDKCDVPKYIEHIFALVRRSNKFIDETMPWKLKGEENCEKLNEVLYCLSESLRICGIYLQPILTKKSQAIFEQLGTKDISFDSAKFGYTSEFVVNKGEPLFKRLEVQKEKDYLENLAREIASQNSVKKEQAKQQKPLKEMITIDDFAKIDLRVGKVVACENVPKSNKLLKLTIEDGEKTRTIVSGIAKSYTAQQMVGKSVVFVANLKPALLRGVQSEGMILCGEDAEGNLEVITSSLEAGSEVR